MKLKLRKEVKLFVAGILVIGSCIALLNNQYKNSVERCVDSGNNYNMCVGGLR